MKNSIKLLIIMILVILGIVISIIAFAMSTTVNKDAILAKNKQKILDGYTQMTNDSGTNTELRNQLTEKLATFSNETYPQEHESYVELLTKYNENISTMTTHTYTMNELCKEELEDARITVVCRSYKMLYEDVVNRYVANVSEYNSKIRSYNETAQTPYNEFEMIQKEYIDYDKDKIYWGKPTE